MPCAASLGRFSCRSSFVNSLMKMPHCRSKAVKTISQPYIVAFMTEALALEGGGKVLEIGAGSGYAAAILSKIAGEVYTVERIGQLAEKAASKLADLGYHNVRV